MSIVSAPVLSRQLRIPNLVLKLAEQAAEARSWAAEFDALPPRPAASVAVPTRHGATLVELHQGYERLLRADANRSVARLIAASTKMGNPIVWSLARNEDRCTDLDEREVWPSEVSQPLATHHAKQGDGAVAAVRASRGWGYAASDTELTGLANQLLRTERLDVAPASTASIAALHFAAKLGRLEPDAPHVAVVYTRGHEKK